MICSIHGTLESVTPSSAYIALEGGLTYEVLLPSSISGRLAGDMGKPVTLHTLHFLEGNAQGSQFIPRLAGFVTEADRSFFELFITVKGIGPRKAMRALSMSTAQIAAAIADRDSKMLQSLPEIGKRTAETIIATLHGRVDAFLDAPGGGASAGAEAAGAEPQVGRGVAREALEVLLQLGENRTQAARWIDEVLTRDPEIDEVEQLITAVLRLKSGV